MLKDKIKSIYRNTIVVRIIAHIYVLYLFFVYFSSKKTYEGYEHMQKIWADDKSGIIYSFWHSRLMLIHYIKFPSKRKYCGFISPHRDGQFSAVMCKYFKATPIYGSTNRKAKKALKEAIRYLKNNYIMMLTPDGPVGPAQIAAPGGAHMSQLTDSWILPVTYSSSKKKTLKTWDGLILPLPFGKLHYVIAPPFKASHFKGDNEKCRLHLQNELNNITKKCDQYCQK